MKKLILFEANERRVRDKLWRNTVSTLGGNMLGMRKKFDDYILYQFLLPARIRICQDYKVTDLLE